MPAVYYKYVKNKSVVGVECVCFANVEAHVSLCCPGLMMYEKWVCCSKSAVAAVQYPKLTNASDSWLNNFG